jgi:transcription elongation factor
MTSQTTDENGTQLLLGLMRQYTDPLLIDQTVKVVRGRWAGCSGIIKGYWGTDFYRVRLNSGNGSKTLHKDQVVIR